MPVFLKKNNIATCDIPGRCQDPFSPLLDPPMYFHLNTLLAISMAECLVANKILYCIVLYLIINIAKAYLFAA